mgnify:CR=1 FL=1
MDDDKLSPDKLGALINIFDNLNSLRVLGYLCVLDAGLKALQVIMLTPDTLSQHALCFFVAGISMVWGSQIKNDAGPLRQLRHFLVLIALITIVVSVTFSALSF